MFRTRYTLLLAVLAIVGVIIGSCSTQASARVVEPTNCWKAGTYNVAATVGEEVSFEVDLGEDAVLNTFTVRRCQFNGIRVEITKANTPAEFKAMRSEVMDFRGHTTPWLFCVIEKGEKAKMVHWTWHSKLISKRSGERAAYTKWAMGYKAKHGCRQSY